MLSYSSEFFLLLMLVGRLARWTLPSSQVPWQHLSLSHTVAIGFAIEYLQVFFLRTFVRKEWDLTHISDKLCSFFKESSFYFEVTSAYWQGLKFPAAFPPRCAAELCSQQSPDLLIAIIKWIGLQPHKAMQPHRSRGRLCWWWQCMSPPSKACVSLYAWLQMLREGKWINMPSCF